jgi:KDO2-lipid IV(A) lauroyltransferase
VAYREGLGMEVIPTSGGERPPFDTLEARLRDGHCLCLLADRDMTASGVPVRFADGVATVPAGPARLALRTGATVLPVGLWYPKNRRGWEGRVHPPVDHPTSGSEPERIAVMSQRIADVFTEVVVAHPEDWHMLARFWRDDVPTPAHGPAATRPVAG